MNLVNNQADHAPTVYQQFNLCKEGHFFDSSPELKTVPAIY